MYVAVLRVEGRLRFELRRSVPVEGGLGYEVLTDLGPDPWRAVRFGRFGMEYSGELLDALAHLDVDPDELDAAFELFAPQGYSSPADRSKVWRRTVLNRVQEDEIRALHPFDRRRMAYLRSGAVDLSRIDELNPRLFRKLAGKSRDELEQLFLGMERSLPREEARSYVHATLNLQRHFSELTARIMPEALDAVRLDEAFLHEFCALLDDPDFGFGLPSGSRSYLLRYAFMHFDSDFPASDGFRRIFEDFMNDFRRPQPRPRPRPVEPERVRELFGLSMAEIRKMSRREFARAFRRRAMSMHPDKGGDHDVFVELLDMYKRIVRGKSEV